MAGATLGSRGQCKQGPLLYRIKADRKCYVHFRGLDPRPPTPALRGLAMVDGAVLALLPTFVNDDVHPAGLQAIEISRAGGSPHLIPRWQAPSFTDRESLTAFRGHPGGVAVVDVAGEPFAAVVDNASPGGRGTLYWVRVRNGEIVQRIKLAGPGQRFAPPLAVGNAVYVPSCDHTGLPNFNEGPSNLEAFSISIR